MHAAERWRVPVGAADAVGRAAPAASRRPLALAATAWLLLVATAVVVVLMSIERIHGRYLERDAEAVAADWSRFIVSSVPDNDLLFEGERPSPPGQAALQAQLASSGVYRFRLYSPQGGKLLESESLSRRPEDFGVRSELAAAAAREGRAVVQLLQGDGRSDPRHFTRAFAPVRDHGGRVLGVVEVAIDQSVRTAAVSAAMRDVALVAVAALTLVIAAGGALWWAQRRREQEAETRMRYLAQHDPLTGALNRECLGRRLTAACARPATAAGAGFAVLCLDLDRFKDVNDTLGHAAGDELLRQCTARLQAALRGGDTLARLGGDEFAALLPGVADAATVEQLAERLVQAVSEPFDLVGRPARVGISIGAVLHGVHGHDPETLLRRADLALYRAKAGGRSRVSLYDPSLDQAQQERRTLTRELHEALDRGALALHFQPLHDRDGRLRGYEALARWPHPRRGFVPPSEFIALAEQTGLIDRLGRWVLETACREAARWPAPLGVAVNLSAAQFRSPGAVVDEVASALQRSGLAPARLELEITESLLLNNTDAVLATLHRLRALGARVAMDDFGTGYSSLAYLWRFPFDKLKIDRAFTQGIGSEPKVELILRSIVTLAHALGIRVNAEGIETEAQRDALLALGVDELQGYLLGRPQPPEALAHRTPGNAAAQGLRRPAAGAPEAVADGTATTDTDRDALTASSAA